MIGMTDVGIRLTGLAHVRRRRSVSVGVHGGDGHFVLGVGQQRLQDQTVLTRRHRSLEAETQPAIRTLVFRTPPPPPPRGLIM